MEELFMENTNIKDMEKFLKETENAYKEYAKALADGLDKETISIDDIESMMMNTISKIKKGFMNYTQDKLAEQDKKKLK